MNIEQAELDRWACFAEEVRARTLTLAASAPEPARSELLSLHTAAARMLARMETAGAATPEELPPPAEVPLHLLDTPANRRLAHALQEAYAAAVEVDRERGYYPEGPAEFIEDMLRQVEQEIHGPESPAGG